MDNVTIVQMLGWWVYGAVAILVYDIGRELWQALRTRTLRLFRHFVFHKILLVWVIGFVVYRLAGLVVGPVVRWSEAILTVAGL